MRVCAAAPGSWMTLPVSREQGQDFRNEMGRGGSCAGTCVIRRTDAGVVVDPIDAGRVVLAVVVLAVVRVYLAALALETGRTHTTAHTHTKKVTSISCSTSILL